MKVLLAEDSLTMRRALASHLQKWNYEVTEVTDGAAAWEAFRQDHFELVLTDWMMPEMDGLELIRKIRKCQQQHYVYIVLLTARSENEDLVHAMEAGADDFLGKPCNPKELRVRLAAGERILALEHRLLKQNRQLQDAQAALIQSEKLAGVAQLASGMAHEINNPIAFVANNLAVLQRDVQGLMDLTAQYSDSRPLLEKQYAEKAAELLALENQCELPWLEENLPQLFQSSTDGLNRVREIVENLRDFAHLDEAEWDNMDVSHALNSTIEVLTPELDMRQLSIERQIEEGLVVHCRPAKIKQVFHGILLNAAQASQPGQEIIVTAARANDDVLVRIVDEGAGIDADTRTHLFEPFFTTRNVGAGRGLGLAVSYGIVRQHSGNIEVDTQPGRGSEFRIRLPMRQKPSET
ncbi:MAG: hypothetical protein Fues2KO_15870 [Fuerstiella sp.]